MAEMSRDVEMIGSSPATPAPRSRPARSPEVLDAIPVAQQRERPAQRQQADPPSEVLNPIPIVTFRQQLLEMSWSLVLATLFAALGTALWGALALRVDSEGSTAQALTQLSSMFFLSLAACWIVLIPGKLWTERRGDSWTRRIIMLLLGGVLGLFACWVDGWSPGQTWRLHGVSQPGVRLFPAGIAVEASYIAYYALAFFVLRWWRMTSRRRTQRFSFAPLLGAGFWAGVLLLLIQPQHLPGTVTPVVVLVMAATIIQLVSPWDEPPAQPARKVRLRYA
jgi:hypothetical protein